MAYTVVEPGHVGYGIHLSQGIVLTESGSWFLLSVVETSGALTSPVLFFQAHRRTTFYHPSIRPKGLYAYFWPMGCGKYDIITSGQKRWA